MAGFDNDNIFGLGIDLSGNATVSNQLNTDGFLLIGSTAGAIGAGLPTSSDNSITWSAGSGTLSATFNLASQPSIVTKIDTDLGMVMPSSQLFRILGGTGITTSGSANIVTITSTGGGGSTPVKEYWFSAESLQPLETAFAPIIKLDGTTVDVFVRAFANATSEQEEYANGKLQVPGDVDTGATVTFRVYAMAATAAADKNVAFTFGHVALNDGEDFDVAYTDEDSGDVAINATQDNVTEITWTETIANLGWEPNDIVIFRLSRPAASAEDLAGDVYVFSLAIEIPRT